MNEHQHNVDVEDVRGLLHRAVDDVWLRGDFAQVRVAARPRRQHWLAPVVAVAATVAVVLGGVAVVAQLQQRSPSSTVDDGTDPIAPTGTPTEGGRAATVTTWFVGRTGLGPRLFPERHVLQHVHGTDLDSAVSYAVESGPDDPDFNAWPGQDLQAFASAVDGTVVIDLSEDLPRPPTMTVAEARMMLQSLVWTASDALATQGGDGGDRPVRFTVQGRPIGSLLGVPVGAPLSKAPADQVMSPVQITSPQQGQTVSRTFTVMGQASTPEANVVWELWGGNHVVQSGYATAAECCTLAPYVFEVTAPPGTYAIVVHDTDDSDGEGVTTTQDTREIVVK